MKALLLLGTLLLASPALAQPAQPNAPGKVRGNPMRGEALARLWCTGCHAVEAAPVAGDLGPTFGSIAHDPSKGPDYLRGFLARPHAPMPPIQFSGDEIEDLVAYFHQLARQP
jgi:mono/diheme cytochrome c family protein